MLRCFIISSHYLKTYIYNSKFSKCQVIRKKISVIRNLMLLKQCHIKFIKVQKTKLHPFHHMDSEPRWLDIDDELYPETLIMKQCLFENTLSGSLHEFYQQIKYNSFKRQIDLTPVVYKYFVECGQFGQEEKGAGYEILIRERQDEKFHLVGFFPHDDTFMLGEQFLSDEMLYFIVKKQEKLNQQFQNLQVKQSQMCQHEVHMQQARPYHEQKPKASKLLQLSKQEGQLEQTSKGKPSKRRTIEQVLKMIAEWRKLIMIKKLSLQEAADKIGMSKRSLEDYFTIIKLAEKHGFDFQTKMNNAFAELRTFVKYHHESKPAPKVQILQKFKNNKN